MECYAKLDFITLACIKCQQPMNVYSENIKICTKCSLNEDFYNEMRAALSYNGFLKTLILRFKNNNEVYLSNILTKILYLRSKDLIVKDAIIAPVPLYLKKTKIRGYNQSSFLANDYARIANIKYIDDLLIREKNTTTQSGKSAKERLSNVHQAFILNKKYNIKDKVIFIIDDIITTGATIFECARTVKEGSPKAVYLLCIGRRVL